MKSQLKIYLGKECPVWPLLALCQSDVKWINAAAGVHTEKRRQGICYPCY